MNVVNSPIYDTGIYTYDMLCYESVSGKYYLIVATAPVEYTTNYNSHQATSAEECNYITYESTDLSTWTLNFKTKMLANGKVKLGTYNEPITEVQYNVLSSGVSEPETTPEPESTPTPTPEVTTSPDVTTEPEATPEASTSPTLPSNITVVVGDEVIETLRTIQEVNEQNRDLLTTIQESSTESMAVLYSQYEAQHNFNFAVMAMLGLIFGAIFIKGIFHKR